MQRELRFTGVLDTGETVVYSESVAAPDEKTLETISTNMQFNIGRVGMMKQEGSVRRLYPPHRFHHIDFEENSIMVIESMPPNLLK